MRTPDFNKSAEGLIPVIVQDLNTSKVLMLGYMNEEAYEATLKKKRVTFYSRSKKRLWTKGEESGNFLEVAEVLLDCDDDTLLIKAKPLGPVCHTGADTCFNEINKEGFLSELERIINDRRINPSENSYVSSLFKKGPNKIAQKVGEEAVELVIEAMGDNKERFKEEAADLLFHYLILLEMKGISLKDVTTVLEKRQRFKIE